MTIAPGRSAWVAGNNNIRGCAAELRGRAEQLRGYAEGGVWLGCLAEDNGPVPLASPPPPLAYSDEAEHGVCFDDVDIPLQLNDGEPVSVRPAPLAEPREITELREVAGTEVERLRATTRPPRTCEACSTTWPAGSPS